MIKNLIIAALVAVIAIGGAVAFAQSRTATVDVAVFRSTSDATTLHVATRPEGGRWKTEQQPLSVWTTTSSGRWQVSEHVRVTVAVPEPDAPGEQDVCAPPPVSHTKSACESAYEDLETARNTHQPAYDAALEAVTEAAAATQRVRDATPACVQTYEHGPFMARYRATLLAWQRFLLADPEPTGYGDEWSAWLERAEPTRTPWA